MAMTVRGWWAQPVVVWVGTECRVTCTAEAAIVLRDRWPVPKGPLHEAARDACEYAMYGTGNHNKARIAFIQAAKKFDLIC